MIVPDDMSYYLLQVALQVLAESLRSRSLAESLGGESNTSGNK